MMSSTFPDDQSPCPVRGASPGLVGIAGNTGVGKSRLISELLGIIAASFAAGRPQTIGLHKYRRRGVGLCFVDSPGFENLNVDATYDLVRRDIGLRAASRNPDEQYYAYILCILESSTRIQDSDRRIHQLCQTVNIPMVIVLTKASPDFDDARDFLRQINRNFPRVPVVRVNVGREFQSKRVGIDELVTVLTRLVTRGREAVVGRLFDNENFERATVSLLQTSLTRAQEIALDAGKWSRGVAVPGASILVIRNAEEKILAMVADVFHFQITDSLGIDILSRWRTVALDEYMKLGAFMVAQTGYWAAHFLTCGLSSVGALGLLKFGDKIGVDTNKGFEAVRAFQPSRIVGMFASVVIHSLLDIRRESHERAERTPQYATELGNRLDRMFTQCRDSIYPELHWDG
jgi:GTP-binding protein EngB required for normal cell division